MPQDRRDTVIFDLGGVLLDFDFERANKAAAHVSGLHSDEVRRRLFACQDFVAFERGEIQPGGKRIPRALKSAES